MKQQDEIALDPSAGTAPTDTQRLDWMAARGIYICIEGDGQFWLARELEPRTGRNGVQSNEYPTVRAAIDAAMNGTDPFQEMEA